MTDAQAVRQVQEAWIPGEPVAKGRPRFTKGHTYTPRQTKEAEHWVGWELKAAGAQLDAESRFGVAVRFTTKRRADIDNLGKLVLDAGNGVIWADDSQIDDLHLVRVREGDVGTRVRWWTL